VTERPGRLALFRQVAQDRRLRRLVLSFGLYSVAEQATWLAVTVFAFLRGGVGEAGVVAFVQLAPGLVLTPLLSTTADRYRADVVLCVGYAVQAMLMGATGAAMLTDAPGALVYALATAVAVTISLSRPAIGAVLPVASPTPIRLAAARVSLGVSDNLGALAGPAVAALLLTLDDGPAVVFLVMGATMIVATALAAGLGLDRSLVAPLDENAVASPWRSVIAGFEALRADHSLGVIVAVTTLAGYMLGVCDMLFVAVADHVLDGSTSGAGWFAAGFGLGCTLGAVAVVSIVLRVRLLGPLALALAIAGLAIASLAAMTVGATITIAFAAAGAGNAIAEITGSTLVARFAAPEVLGRVYGVMEGLRIMAIALGSVAVSAVVGWMGLRWGIVVLGLAVPVLLLPAAGAVRRVDAETPARDPLLLRLLTTNPIFAHLPPPALEQLISAADTDEAADGAEVVRQGERGDSYFLIAQGEATVSVDGRPVRTLGPGDGFGEIALVRDVPRTATVIAAGALTMYRLQRADFLAALGGTPAAFTAADRHVQSRLDEDETRGGSTD